MLNNHIIRYGGDFSDKRSFFRNIAKARDAAFKPPIIRESFKNCGVWPFDPDSILKKLEAKVDPTPDLKIFGDKTTPPLETSSPLDSPSRTPRSTQRSVNKIYKQFQKQKTITPDFERRVKRALTRGIATSNLIPILQRELTTAIDFKTQGEKPKSRRQLKDSGALSSRNAKRQIKDRAARERLTAYRREVRNTEKLAKEPREEQDILEKRRSGEIPPPDNPVDLMFWYDEVGDPLLRGIEDS